MSWQHILLCFNGKEYPVRHNYVELLKILELKWLFDIRDNCPFWNIKGIGKMRMDSIQFVPESKTLKIVCKPIIL